MVTVVDEDANSPGLFTDVRGVLKRLNSELVRKSAAEVIRNR